MPLLQGLQLELLINSSPVEIINTCHCKNFTFSQVSVGLGDIELMSLQLLQQMMMLLLLQMLD